MHNEQAAKYNNLYWRLYDLLYYMALTKGKPHTSVISDAFGALEKAKDEGATGNDLTELDKMLHSAYPELNAKTVSEQAKAEPICIR